VTHIRIQAVPTVRYESEDVLSEFSKSVLLRINLDESEGPPRTVSIPETGLRALQAISSALG
jgi:hypothetical protein